MASDYDALLSAAPQPQQKVNPYDALLSVAPVPPSPAPQTAKALAETPSILRKAGEAALETVKEMIPRTAGQVVEMLTPVASVPRELGQTFGMVKDVLGGKPIEQAVRERAPEVTVLEEAQKTPEYSKERFKAGFGMLAQAGMAGLAARALTPKRVAVKPAEGVIPDAERIRENAGQVPETRVIEESRPAQGSQDLELRPQGRQDSGAGKEVEVVRQETPTPQGQVAPQGQAKFEANLLHGSPSKELAEVSAAPASRQYDNATSQFGAFFSANPAEAARYAGESGKVYPVKVRLQNPAEMTWNEFAYFQNINKAADGATLAPDKWEARQVELKIEARRLREQLEAKGHDGVIVRSAKTGQPIEVASFKNVPIVEPRPSSVSDVEQRGPAVSESDISESQPAPNERSVSSATQAPVVPELQPQTRVKGGLGEEAQKSVPAGQETLLEEGRVQPPPPEPLGPTSTKNAVVDKERASRGLPPAMEQGKREFGTVWDEAVREVDNNPAIQDQLVNELSTNPRAVSDRENALLLHRQVDLQNQFEKASNELFEATAKNDTVKASELDARVNQLSDNLVNLYDVTKSSGAETGRGLNARKMLANEDFSLAKMVTRKRVAKGGKQLTPEETGQVRQQHRKILTLQEQLDKRLSLAKKRTIKRTEELKGKTERGDFSKKTRVEIQADKELNQLRADLDLAKREYRTALEKDKWNRFSVFQKSKKTAVRTYDAARLLLTTGEFSFILRQGKFYGVSHPIQAAKAVPKMLKAMKSERTASAIDNEIFNHPEIANARADKLALIERDASLNRQEELIMGDWANTIPVVSSFNRAARVYLNKIRFDNYLAGRKSMVRNGIPTREEGRAIAAYVNESTGRGSLGARGEPAAVILSRFLFSPRYLASRIQYAVGHSLWMKGAGQARKFIAKEYARTLIGMAIYYNLLSMLFQSRGDSFVGVEFDPRSSEFGKIRIGNTRLDLMAGLAQLATFGGRSWTGETKTVKGEVRPIRGENIPYGGDTWRDVASRFAWTKAHPVPSTIANLLSGIDLAGNVVTPTGEALKSAAPITYGDVYQALQEENLESKEALALLAFLGEGLQTYKPKEKKAAGPKPDYSALMR